MLPAKRVASVAACFLSLGFAMARAQERDVLYGFTAFPHDLTAEAVDQVHERILPNATLYAQHMDQCLPWHAALTGGAFPPWLQNDLKEIRKRRTPQQIMYVAVTPTKNDRRSVAAACAETEGEERSMPSALRSARLNAPALKTAYVNYVRRIADELKPAYMIVAIEISELAIKHPGEWAAFDELFRHTVDAMRQSHPDVKIGLEIVLQSVMKQSVGDMVKPAAEYGDFIGVSFYPYGGEYGVKLGAPALPAPPEQWRAPLRFLRQWTAKPVAMAETGYTTANVRLADAGIDFKGDPVLQKQFLEDLIEFAVRDSYLFVVWFVAIDYTRLMAKFRDMGTVQEWMNIWVNTGLFDADLRPKAAFEIWSRWQNQAAIRAAPPRL